MRCEEEVAGYCMKAIRYKKYAEYRECNKCCLECKVKCDEVCDKVLEVEEC